jgi:hypothetical protein
MRLRLAQTGFRLAQIGLRLAQNRWVGTETPNVFNASVKNVLPGGGICLSKERIFIFKTASGANQVVLKKLLDSDP